MKFVLNKRYLDKGARIENGIDLVLEQNYWDDFGYKTTFEVYVPKRNSRLPQYIGSLSIANLKSTNEYEQQISDDSQNAPTSYNAYEDLTGIYGGFFNRLDSNTCSLGNEMFYNSLNELLDNESVTFTREEILISLNDIAFNPILFHQFENEPVIKTSFLRGISPNHVLGQLNRIATGQSETVPYSFNINYHNNGKTTTYNFATSPEDLIPTNVHAIIGNNGTGKTRFLKDMVKAISAEGEKVESEFGEDNNLMLDFNSDGLNFYDFSGILFISFSPFDDVSSIFEFDEDKDDLDQTFHSKYIGVLDVDQNAEYKNGWIKGWEGKFNEAVQIIQKDPEKTKLFWKQTEYLEFIRKKTLSKFDRLNDNWESLSLQERRDVFANLVNEFVRMSSGEKIVALGLVSLVAYVKEKTLVLFDEPELYLHPPLVSNYIRVISEVMSKKNGLAILVTHSPIILQEVSNECVYITDSGDNLLLKRLSRPTFGENVSILTNGIFGLDIEESGFYVYLKKFFENNKATNRDKISKLDESTELGSEARFFLNILIANNEDDV